MTQNSHSKFRVSLGVFGDVEHYTNDLGEIYAFEPYVREMRVWADLFQEVHLYSPAGNSNNLFHQAPFDRSNVQWHRIPYSMRRGQIGMANRIFNLPKLLFKLYKGITNCDFVHLRSPSQVGFVGAFLVRLLKRGSLTKWAGNNGLYNGQSLTARLDLGVQWIESKRNPVLVYGETKRSHQISFIPALMSYEELEIASSISRCRLWNDALNIICVARLSSEKNITLVISGLGELLRLNPGLKWRATIVGDGPERNHLERMIQNLNLASRIRFTGFLPFSEVSMELANAHILVQPNPNEGWPKVIAEAWAHGVVPMGPNVGICAHILSDPEFGILFKPTELGFAEAISVVMSHPERLEQMSRNGPMKASNLSLENFKSHLERVLIQYCGLEAHQ